MRHIINTGNGSAMQAKTLPVLGLVAITSMNRNNIKNGDVFHTAYLTPAEVGAFIASLQMCGEHVEKWDSFLPSDLEAEQAERAAGYVAKYEAKSGAGVRCHGDLCAAGQIACPTPKACGVAA